MVRTRTLDLMAATVLMAKIKKIMLILFFLASITFCFGQKEKIIKLTVNGSSIYVNEDDYSETQGAFPALNGIEIQVWYPDGRSIVQITNLTQKKIKLQYEVKYHQLCLQEDSITKKRYYFVEDTTELFTKKGTVLMYCDEKQERWTTNCVFDIFYGYGFREDRKECYIDGFDPLFKEIIINYKEE